MDPATNDHRLVQSLTSFFGNARSSVLRLTLFVILAFVLFQLVSVSHFGRCDGWYRITRLNGRTVLVFLLVQH